jgi:hypothetical protein
MTTPSVHYGDKVVTVPEQFNDITSRLERLGKQLNLLSIIIALHLLGFDLAVGTSLLKLIGVAV